LIVLIPALVGGEKGSEGYVSLDRQALTGLDGSRLGETTITPPVLVRAVARRSSSALSDLPVQALLKVFRRAADVFSTGQPDGLAPETFVRNVTLTSGLPLSVSRNRTIGLFSPALGSMERFLEVQSPAGLDVFDRHVYASGGVQLALTPRGRNVGFVMPGNHPATHFMWLGALAMKIPVILRPSIDDLFTPYRLVRSLLEAGLPEDAVAFVPGAHDLVDAVVEACPLTVLFGGQQIAERYGGNSRIRIHGPGRSKVVVCADADFDETVRLIVRLVMDDAGRGCINASAVIVEGSAGKLASAVAAALDRVPVLSPLAESAQLGVMLPSHAAAFTATIESRLGDGARELAPGSGRRVATIDGMTVMRPMVIEVPGFEHSLFGLELPFPFVVFASARRADLVTAARNSLAVIVAGDNSALVRELLLEPTIDKVLGQGALSTEFDPLEPHEGFLLEFLYQKKALRLGARAPA
jgi:acyl-CoA reductase-like NAD-dependent aldehyde dehydrogenase